jgi:hypothetical protein
VGDSNGALKIAYPRPFARDILTENVIKRSRTYCKSGRIDEVLAKFKLSMASN